MMKVSTVATALTPDIQSFDGLVTDRAGIGELLATITKPSGLL
jgi:hypothetical protein